MPIQNRQRPKDPSRKSRVSGHFDGSHEPEFKPKYPYWLVGPDVRALELEIFKFRVWRTFRKHTGRWPVVSICFHFVSGVALLAGIILWYLMTNDWSGVKSWTSFAIGVAFWGIVGEVGTVTARKLDWRLFGRK
jgi:hypothetical protein